MGNPMETRGGKRPGAGRPPGSPGRLNGAFREAVQIVYNDMGGHQAFTKWAKKNQTEFYKIASRLIPVEVHGTSDRTINVYVNRSVNGPMVDAVPPMIEHCHEPSDAS